MTPTLPTLQKWSLGPVQVGPYEDPNSATGMACHGTVTNHPNHRDGTEIITSLVRELDTQTGTLITESRSYILGKMCQKYAKWRTSCEFSEIVMFKKHP
jgi:hypothetical protein